MKNAKRGVSCTFHFAFCLLHSGVTSEFLMNDLRARGAASVKLATLLDRQSARRVQLLPDYFGFLVDEAFLVGLH